MKRITTMMLIMSLATALFALFAAATVAHAAEKKEKPLRIKWENVEGIIKYNVQIKDSEDAVTLDRTVKTNYIDFTLPPGKYQIRIGAINKFEKVSFWTDWDVFEIRKTVRQKFFTNDFPAKGGIKINAGVAYYMVLPSWNTLYKNSAFNLQQLSYFGSLGFHFGNSKAIKSTNFLRFMGIELEGSYTHYAGKKSFQFYSDLKAITGGINVFAKTQLTIPLNFYIRLGCGAAYSMQKYTRRILERPMLGFPIYGSVKSIDPYAKIGVSMEINFLYALSLNIGADYYMIFYPNNAKFFHNPRFYAMLGFRI